jgi:hypothetical protein
MKGTWILFAMVVMTGCSDSKLRHDATLASKEFFSAIKSGDTERATSLYAGFGELPSYFKSDSISVREVFVMDTLVVSKVRNYFTNLAGKKSERDIDLYFAREKDEPLVLVDSKGMSDFKDNEDYTFAVSTGCIDPGSDTLDLRVSMQLKVANDLMIAKTLDLWLELRVGCVVENWSWETGYSGSASGKGIVVNNTTYRIPRVKYKITYKDRAGSKITTDDGYVTYDALEPLGSKSFTFYTSYVGNAQTASIELVFDDELLMDYVKKATWTGSECAEFLASKNAEKEAEVE